MADEKNEEEDKEEGNEKYKKKQTLQLLEQTQISREKPQVLNDSNLFSVLYSFVIISFASSYSFRMSIHIFFPLYRSR